MFLGAIDNFGLVGYNILHELVNNDTFISVVGFYTFNTEDVFFSSYSNMGIIMIASPITIEEVILRFLHDPSDFIQNEITEEGILLGSRNVSIDPRDYHLSNVEKSCSRKLKKVHTLFVVDDSDERNRTVEMELDRKK